MVNVLRYGNKTWYKFVGLLTAVVLVLTLILWFRTMSNVKPIERKLQIKETRDKDGTLLRTESYYIAADGREVSHGPTICFHAQGQKSLEQGYRDGKLNGPIRRWGSDGELITEENYQDNMKTGHWTRWAQGKRYEDILYENDRVQGYSRWDSSSGLKMSEQLFDARGRRVEVNEWYQSGAKEMHGTFFVDDNTQPPHDLAIEDDCKDGEWIYWAEDGFVEARGVWRKGQPWQGICGISVETNGSLSGISNSYVIHSQATARYENGKKIEDVDLFHPTKHNSSL